MKGTLQNISFFKYSPPLDDKNTFHINHVTIDDWSSYGGSVVMNLAGVHEDVGLIPDLAWWVRDLALP